MKILHTSSSALIRPNGIVRYINQVIALQQSAGHSVMFACDSDPTQYIKGDCVWDKPNPSSEYVPNTHPTGHVWLQIDDRLIDKLRAVLLPVFSQFDVIVAHDLHSYLAAAVLTQHGVFIQHESDVLNQTGRYSYLSDEYLAQQIAVVNSENTAWCIGTTIGQHDVKPRQTVFTPAPFEMTTLPTPKQRSGLLFVGEATERKGAREFMALARRLGVRPTVITWDVGHEIFADADTHRFEFDQHHAMLELINQHAVAYIPSKNECPGLAVLECLQYIPVVLDGQYRWTRNLAALGAIVREGAAIDQAVEQRLNFSAHYTGGLAMWSKHANYIWTQGFTNWPATRRR